MSIILKILSVVVIIACAVGGTIGLMKLIKKIPGMTDENGEFKESRIAQKLHEAEASRMAQYKEGK